MNKRIQELVERCTTKENTYSDRFGNQVHSYFDKYKFADLIIRECCDIFVELRTRPADLAVKDVKKHFGVKE